MKSGVDGRETGAAGVKEREPARVCQTRPSHRRTGFASLSCAASPSPPLSSNPGPRGVRDGPRFSTGPESTPVAAYFRACLRGRGRRNSPRTSLRTSASRRQDPTSGDEQGTLSTASEKR